MAIAPAISGVLAGILGAKLARNRGAPAQRGVSSEGLVDAVLVLLGSLGLLLSAGIAISQDQFVPFSIVSASMLALGIYSHLTAPRPRERAR